MTIAPQSRVRPVSPRYLFSAESADGVGTYRPESWHERGCGSDHREQSRDGDQGDAIQRVDLASEGRQQARDRGRGAKADRRPCKNQSALWRSSRPATASRVAPNATRTAISCVRCATNCANKAYSPVMARPSAIKPRMLS